MRNLKRALSLTLASVMLLGMMVVGASAKGYSDVTEEENIEAIEVLQAVGVMAGIDEDHFNPDGTVTREQMAVIMAQLLKLNYDYYQGANPFSDVPSWAAKYVAACVAEGITAGIGGGMYGAGQNVNAVQAALMMMKALGYFQYEQDFDGNYILATVRKASEIGMFNGIDSNAEQALTRNEVAQMALNALCSRMVDFTGDVGTTIPTANGDVVVGYKSEYTFRTNTQEKYAAIDALTSDVASSINHKGQYYVELGEERYDGDLRRNGDVDDFDRPAVTWEYKTEAIGTYTNDATYTYTLGVSEKDLYNRVGTLANSAAYNWNVYHNGEWIGGNELKPVSSKTSTWSQTGRGVLTQVYIDNANDTVVVSMINTLLAEVNRVSGDNVSLTYKGSAFANITSRQTQIELENTTLQVGDKVLVNLYEDGNTFTVASVKVADSVNGTVTAVKSRYDNGGNLEGSYAVMDGTTYNYVAKTFAKDLAETNLDNPTINSENTLYLDAYGNMIAFAATERKADYLYVQDAHDYIGGVQALVTFADGTSKIITVTELTQGGTTTKGSALDVTSTYRKLGEPDDADNAGNVVRGQVYGYTQQGENYKLTSLTDVNPDKNSGAGDKLNTWTNYPSAWAAGQTYGQYDNGYSSVDGIPSNFNKVGGTGTVTTYTIKNGVNSILVDYADSTPDINVISLTNNTIFVDVESGKVYNGVSEVPTMAGINFYAIYNRQLNADVVFITDGGDNSTSNAFFYVTDWKPLSTQTDGNSYYEFSVWMNGEKTTLTTRGTNRDNTNLVVDEHTLYKIEKITPDGYVTEFSKAPVFNTTWDDSDYYAVSVEGNTIHMYENAAVPSGSNNNPAANYTVGSEHTLYRWNNETIFMDVQLKENGDVKSVNAVIGNAGIINSEKDTQPGKNNVYVMAVDDNTARAPMAELVYVVTPYEYGDTDDNEIESNDGMPYAWYNTGDSNKIQIRYHGQLPNQATLVKLVEDLTGLDVASVNLVSGKVVFADGTNADLSSAPTQEMISVSIGGTVVGYAVKGTSTNVSNASLTNGDRYMLSTATAPVAQSSTYLVSGGAIQSVNSNTDITLVKAYSVTLTSVDGDATIGTTKTAGMTSGNYVPAGTKLDVTGQITSGYSRLKLNGEYLSAGKAVSASVKSTATVTVNSNVTLTEVAVYKVTVGTAESAYYAAGEKVELVAGQKYGLNMAAADKTVAAASLKAGAAEEGKVLYTVDSSDASSGDITLTPVIVVNVATGLTVEDDKASPATVNDGDGVKAGTVLALSIADPGTTNDGKVVNVQVGASGTKTKVGDTLANGTAYSASYTVSSTNTLQSVTFTIDTAA